MEKEGNKKLKKFLIVCSIGLVILGFYLGYCFMPLDEITEYQVHVFTEADGSLNITYGYKWKVLNDSKEGPLKWVQLGAANSSYTMNDLGGAAESQRTKGSYSEKEPMVELNLDREYHTGETAEFWFNLNQKKMLCENTEDPEEPFYNFTPGWFNEIRVKHYLFTWVKSDNIVSHNADYEKDGLLVWEGSLDKGKKRLMSVTYRMDEFDEPELVQWVQYYDNKNTKSPVDASMVLMILIITGYSAYSVSWGSNLESYNRGRGYHGHHRNHGGGCACACAGCACACACACAGGGRAGCSKKDFYHSPKILGEDKEEREKQNRKDSNRS